MIDFLNKNPLINFNSFKQKSIDYILKINMNLMLIKIHLVIYFINGEEIRKNVVDLAFFDNIYTKDHTLYLKNVSNRYITILKLIICIGIAT